MITQKLTEAEFDNVEAEYEKGTYPVMITHVQFQAGTSTSDLRNAKRLLEAKFSKAVQLPIYAVEHPFALSLNIFAPVMTNTRTAEFKKFFEQFKNFCNEEFDLADQMIGAGSVWLKGIPEVSIEYNGVNLAALPGLKTFKGIEKKLNCNMLMLNLEGETCGVLSILKIPGLQRIFNVTSSDNKEQRQVVDLLEKNLAEGKNVIACQEELFKNGLDEYAKL